VVGRPGRPALRAIHRPVNGQEQQVGDPVPIAVPHDRVRLEPVALDVLEQPGGGGVRDVEDPDPAYGLVVSVVADEGMVPLEREVGVDLGVGRGEEQIHVLMLVLVVLRPRPKRCGNRQHHQRRHDESPSSQGDHLRERDAELRAFRGAELAVDHPLRVDKASAAEAQPGTVARVRADFQSGFFRPLRISVKNRPAQDR
jgi:hypothetical protein